MAIPVTNRYQVIVWPPAGFGLGPTQCYLVYDTHTRSQLLGRWDTREHAQAHADQCNQEKQ